MTLRHWISGSCLLLLLGGAITGLVKTRDLPVEDTATPTSASASAQAKPNAPRRERLVDEKPLLTARRLAALAHTQEEQALAKQAERLANHDVDLAYTEAVRRAIENPPPLTEEGKRLLQAKEAAEAAVAAGKGRLKRLEALLKDAKGKDQEALEDQLEVAKAQLGLDQDELEEVSEDLERVGGDPQARIRRLKAAHEAADKEDRPTMVSPLPTDGSLINRFKAWRFAQQKRHLLDQARKDALEKVKRISERKAKLADDFKKKGEQAGRREAQLRAQEAIQGKAGHEEVNQAVADLKAHASEQRRLTVMARRIQDERELSEIYTTWSDLVEAQVRQRLHSLYRGMVILAGIFLGVFLLDRLIERLMGAVGRERQRVATLRAVVKGGIIALGMLAAAILVAGMPSQIGTILGLAGAGLTVALKDFIVAFFGWFILMRRNGIRVGDWVEIKGVGGEVVEIGLLRTVLLETGSWNDAGHPTGRRVSFTNSFAMEGHFFNFSTTGQWMWDELRVLVPQTKDPYPILEGTLALVAKETQETAALAEKEWQHVAHRYRVHGFSTAPGIQVVPTSSGVEIQVRYITRAFERHETRRRLYQAVVDLMHGRTSGALEVP